MAVKLQGLIKVRVNASKYGLTFDSKMSQCFKFDSKTNQRFKNWVKNKSTLQNVTKKQVYALNLN